MSKTLWYRCKVCQEFLGEVTFDWTDKHIDQAYELHRVAAIHRAISEGCAKAIAVGTDKSMATQEGRT